MCVSIKKNLEIQNPQVKDKGTDNWLFLNVKVIYGKGISDTFSHP